MSTDEGETIRFGEGAAPDMGAAPPPPPPPEPENGGGEGEHPEDGEPPAEEPSEEPAAEEPEEPPGKKKKKKKKKAKGKKKGVPLVALILLIIAALAVLAFVAVVIVMRLRGGGPPADPTPPPSPSESEEPSPSPTPEPTPTPTPRPPAPQNMTTRELVDYMKALKPSDLKLEGESMADYEILPQPGVAFVGDLECTEVRVYSDKNPTGTNDPQGRYFLTNTAPFKIYLLKDRTMYELAISSPSAGQQDPGGQAEDSAGEGEKEKTG